MDLIEIDNRKAPPTPVVSVIDLADGTELRTARWLGDPGKQPGSQGTVLICTGRGEFIEKYFEVIGDLQARGFAAVVFDWRGQGRSSRALRNARKGHVAHFDQFGADLAAVVQNILAPFCPKPFYLLAHSMGGAVALHYASRNPRIFERIILSAPMVEVHNLPFRRSLPRLVRGLAFAGLSNAFLPQGHRAAVLDRGFVNNVLTSDSARFAEMMALVQADPELAVGAPTVGWLHAAFRAMAKLESLEFCRLITTPMLMVIPGADRVISVPAMERLAGRLKCCTPILIPHARHEIMMESDELRAQFWAAFDAFVPGEGPGVVAPRQLSRGERQELLGRRAG